ncbi:MAG: hypothetical protein NT005_17565 [Spirochaetes bacterium]|nr:hypothetical protein [Spirochaetota bacterium]
MGRGDGSRGPHELRFSALLSCHAEYIDLIVDTRQKAKARYLLRDCYLSSFAMFYLQDASLLEFQQRFEDSTQNNNLRTVFGVHDIPVDSQLRDLIDSHLHQSLSDVYSELFQRLADNGLLRPFHFLPDQFLLTVDGYQYFGRSQLDCPRCPVKEHKYGTRQYFHQILQATVVHPDLRQVIPFAPEFIGHDKQDCEINAAKRLIARLRSAHAQLPFIIVGDGLYPKQPFIQELMREPQRLHFILVAKPADHKDLWTNIAGLRRGGLLASKQFRDKHGRLHHYEWVNEIALNANPKSPSVNFLEYTIVNKNGSPSYHNSWVTDLRLEEQTAEWITRGGRARWKIENESFNTLKNQGYHLEHNFGNGSKYLSEAFFLLNLLAFFFHQIFELTDECYRQARARFSARQEYWNAIRASFSLFLFTCWDEVLNRINSPPLPPFP